MEFTNITNDQGTDNIYIEPLISGNNSPLLKLGTDTINVSEGTGNYLRWNNLDLNIPIKVNDLIDLWNNLFIGPCRFHVSDKIKFQVDPVWSRLILNGNLITVESDPALNEIDQGNLTLLLDTATDLGYLTISKYIVRNNLVDTIYTDDSSDFKSVGTVQLRSTVAIKVEDSLPDIYDITTKQHNFWKALNDQVLISLPSKDLPTIDTLGNTVPLFAYGNIDNYSTIKVIVRYTLQGDSTLRSTSFDIYKDETDKYSYSDIVDGIQIILVSKESNSFLKITFDSDEVDECYIIRAKLID